MCYTLRLVPNLHWIVVEDAEHKTNLVSNFLRSCGVPYTHLNVRSVKKTRFYCEQLLSLFSNLHDGMVDHLMLNEIMVEQNVTQFFHDCDRECNPQLKSCTSNTFKVWGQRNAMQVWTGFRNTTAPPAILRHHHQQPMKQSYILETMTTPTIFESLRKLVLMFIYLPTSYKI